MRAGATQRNDRGRRHGEARPEQAPDGVRPSAPCLASGKDRQSRHERRQVDQLSTEEGARVAEREPGVRLGVDQAMVQHRPAGVGLEGDDGHEDDRASRHAGPWSQSAPVGPCRAGRIRHGQGSEENEPGHLGGGRHPGEEAGPREGQRGTPAPWLGAQRERG